MRLFIISLIIVLSIVLYRKNRLKQEGINNLTIRNKEEIIIDNKFIKIVYIKHYEELTEFKFFTAIYTLKFSNKDEYSNNIDNEKLGYKYDDLFTKLDEITNKVFQEAKKSFYNYFNTEYDYYSNVISEDTKKKEKDKTTYDEEYIKYLKYREEEYLYLINNILNNPETNNKNIEWFYKYKPINEVDNYKSKYKILKKVNEDYKEKLYIDEKYLYKKESTYNTKFFRYYIKFNTGYKRYGCISFYGMLNARIKDYYFYSISAGDFIIKKVDVVDIKYYNKNEQKLESIKNTEIIDFNNVKDIYIFCLSEDDEYAFKMYDGLIFKYLTVYKNDKIIQKIYIRDYNYIIKDEEIILTPTKTTGEKNFEKIYNFYKNECFYNIIKKNK